MPTFATFNTTEGDFKVRLFDDKAPKTVANFVGLAEGTKEWTDPKTRQKVKRPFYDGLDLSSRDRRLHAPGRLPDGQRHGRPRLSVRGRVWPRAARTIARACCRWPTPVPTPTAASSSSRWCRRRWLDNKHAIFGEVVEGTGCRAEIGKTQTGANDRPAKDIVINSVSD